MDLEIRCCTDEDKLQIRDGLRAYNFSIIPQGKNYVTTDISRRITDENGKVIAGCIATADCWLNAHVSTLWVDSAYRKHGLGSKLLAAVEQAAREADCMMIQLDTFEFQAKDFYLRHGYEIFGEVAAPPRGKMHYYLKKDLK